MVQDFGLSDLVFCLGVLQIIRNHFEIERMTGGYRTPSPPSGTIFTHIRMAAPPLRHWSAENLQVSRMGSVLTALIIKQLGTREKLIKQKFPLDHLLFTFLC